MPAVEQCTKEPAGASSGECLKTASNDSVTRFSRNGVLYSEVDCRPGHHLLCCGHVMHEACFERYLAANLAWWLHDERFDRPTNPGSCAGRMEYLCRARELLLGSLPAIYVSS